MLFILNGPNLNLLGERQPEVYGSLSIKEIEQRCIKLSKEFNYSLDFRQTNHEGVLIDWVHEANQKAKGLIINAGGLTHTSISLLDALMCLSIPAIEVHLTNLLKRESFRYQSLISSAVHGVVAGFGASSYTLAIRALIGLINKE